MCTTAGVFRLHDDIDIISWSVGRYDMMMKMLMMMITITVVIIVGFKSSGSKEGSGPWHIGRRCGKDDNSFGNFGTRTLGSMNVVIVQVG